jgi:hypothetical protein
MELCYVGAVIKLCYVGSGDGILRAVELYITTLSLTVLTNGDTSNFIYLNCLYTVTYHMFQ